MLNTAKLKERLEEKGIWWHSQNLNEIAQYRDDMGQQRTIYGKMWRNGRCWIKVKGATLGLNWAFFKPYIWELSTGFDVGGCDEDFKAHFSINRLCWLSMSVEAIPFKIKKNWKKWPLDWELSTGLDVTGGLETIRLEWFRDGSGWNQKAGRRYLSFRVRDWLLGKSHHYTVPLEYHHDIPVHFAEGEYRADVALRLSVWERPRWFRKIIRAADIRLKKPIPVPGKGENSWDIGDDAIYEMSCRASTLAEALGKLVESVLDDRLRRGGSVEMELDDD